MQNDVDLEEQLAYANSRYLDMLAAMGVVLHELSSVVNCGDATEWQVRTDARSLEMTANALRTRISEPDVVTSDKHTQFMAQIADIARRLSGDLDDKYGIDLKVEPQEFARWHLIKSYRAKIAAHFSEVNQHENS